MFPEKVSSESRYSEFARLDARNDDATYYGTRQVTPHIMLGYLAVSVRNQRNGKSIYIHSYLVISYVCGLCIYVGAWIVETQIMYSFKPHNKLQLSCPFIIKVWISDKNVILPSLTLPFCLIHLHSLTTGLSVGEQGNDLDLKHSMLARWACVEWPANRV